MPDQPLGARAGANPAGVLRQRLAGAEYPERAPGLRRAVGVLGPELNERCEASPGGSHGHRVMRQRDDVLVVIDGNLVAEHATVAGGHRTSPATGTRWAFAAASRRSSHRHALRHTLPGSMVSGRRGTPVAPQRTQPSSGASSGVPRRIASSSGFMLPSSLVAETSLTSASATRRRITASASDSIRSTRASAAAPGSRMARALYAAASSSRAASGDSTYSLPTGCTAIQAASPAAFATGPNFSIAGIMSR